MMNIERNTLQRYFLVLLFSVCTACIVLTLTQTSIIRPNYTETSFNMKNEPMLAFCQESPNAPMFTNKAFSTEFDRCAHRISLMLHNNKKLNDAFDKISSRSRPDVQGNLRLKEREASIYTNETDVGLDTNPEMDFDYSRCPLSGPFQVYFYGANEMTSVGQPNDPVMRKNIEKALSNNPYITSRSREACLHFIITSGQAEGAASSSGVVELSSLLKPSSATVSGENYVLLNLATSVATSNALWSIHRGASTAVVQSSFDIVQFRPGLDIVSPMLLDTDGLNAWKDTPSLLPARRRYLLSFQGSLLPSRNDIPRSNNDIGIEKELTRLNTSEGNKFHIELTCQPLAAASAMVNLLEWWICDDKRRFNILKQSTFALIVLPGDHIVSSTMLQMRLYEALKHGSVPVILGEQFHFPLDEFISWEKAAIILPKGRVAELLSYLTSFSDSDVVAMRRQGWFIWTTYLASTEGIINGILATLRTRLSVPATAAPTVASHDAFPENFKRLTKEAKPFAGADKFPAATAPKPSPKYLRNFTIGHERAWNSFPGPFNLYPSTPWDPALPSDAQFPNKPDSAFDPINNGISSSGYDFRKSLGGDYPSEQFTVVILVYDRLQTLISLLEHLNGLVNLNKVIVVWNHPNPPSKNAVWPLIHVEIKVIKSDKNSLNNRFLPYEDIETDAILCLDDDVILGHDVINLGFRVWRESRDRIVGFPARSHSWDTKSNSGFMYTPGSSCEISMVLTGGAFIHVYYTYMYSYEMPSLIRDKVNEFMNCEDIAMNFLVSHITRKPPIKVTSLTRFNCPGCKTALSSKAHHYTDRDKCVQYFTSIYGYTPLVRTQFRADSLSYKSDQNDKCYANV